MGLAYTWPHRVWLEFKLDDILTILLFATSISGMAVPADPEDPLSIAYARQWIDRVESSSPD